MEFRILGPLEVVDGDRRIPLGGRKRRALLAMLILRRQQVVSVDELIDALWGDDPPKTAEHSVQVYVSELRKALGGMGEDGNVVVARHDPGYALDVPPSAIDLYRFDVLRGRGQAALGEQDPARAAVLFREALAIWRGPALADFAYDDFARAEIERLEELRLITIEDRLVADLASGRHAELVAELRALVDEHPARERLRADLMLALYRTGRQAEAIEAFHAGRARLSEEFGLDPSPRLVELASAILASDPSIDLAPSSGDSIRTAARTTRRRRTNAQDRERSGRRCVDQPCGRVLTRSGGDPDHRPEDRRERACNARRAGGDRAGARRHGRRRGVRTPAGARGRCGPRGGSCGRTRGAAAGRRRIRCSPRRRDPDGRDRVGRDS